MLFFIPFKSFSQMNIGATIPKCNELFFSELLFSKIPNGSGIDINYAIEIFNPTSNSINLNNYLLKLINNGGTVSTIPLNGLLPSHKCHVVTNANCKANLASLADELSSTVDLGVNLELSLIKNSVVIDKIGEGVAAVGNNTPFDYAQFLADPYNYLSSIDINLDDFQNIDIRRGHFVERGEPNFSSTKMLGKWSYHLNSDISDIGLHHSVCFSDGLPNIYFEFADKIGEFCDTDPATGPVCCSANDPLLVKLDMNGNSWPNGFKLRVEFNPTKKVGGINNILMDDADANCGLYWDNTWLGSFQTVTTVGTLTQPEAVVWIGEPALFSSSFANGSPHMLNGIFSKPNTSLPVSDFSYEYHFELTNTNNNFNSFTQNNLSNVAIIPAATSPINLIIGTENIHVTRVNKGIACTYITNISGITKEDFSILQSGYDYTINSKGLTFKYTLLDINGKMVLENNSTDKQFTLNNLASGLYILHITCNNQNLNYKIVK